MNTKNVTFQQLVGFIFTALTGTLLHFVYEWSKESVFTAPFSAVNESIWEHMKLIFVPMFIFAIIESRFLKERHNIFWNVKLKGICLALTLIPVIFYTYNGAFGKSPAWVNIAIFFISAAVSYIYETRLFKEERRAQNQLFPFLLLCMIAILFVTFTYAQPHIPLFMDPVTKIYGISN